MIIDVVNDKISLVRYLVQISSVSDVNEDVKLKSYSDEIIVKLWYRDSHDNETTKQLATDRLI